MGLAADGAGRRRAGGAHRRLDRRAPAGGALDAGARRRRRLHRRLRRGRPLHRRLPGRGGAAAPARRGPELPAADLHPRPAERPAVRRRHRPGRRQGHAGGARPRRTCSSSRSTTAATGIATTTSSPTCCRRTCWTSSPTRCRSCTGGRAPGTSRTASRPRRSATRWPPRTSSERRTWSSWPCRRCAGAGRRPRCSAGSRRSPTSWSASGPCSASGTPGRCWPAASSRASRRACGTPSGGWTRGRRATGAARPRWSSWTRRSSAVCRAAIAVYRAGAGPGPGRRGRHRAATPGGRSTSPPRTTISARGGRGAPGARVLGERGPRGSAPVVRRGHGEPAAGRAHRRRPRRRDRPGRHPDRARSSPRGDAHLRAGACSSRRSRASRCCGERRTCTWA